MNTVDLQHEVYEANMELYRRGLVLYTFGNVSGIDRDRGVFAIKPWGSLRRASTTTDRGSRPRWRGGQQTRAAPFVGHPHPSLALPSLGRCGRHRPHPQHLRHRLGTGPA